MPLMKMCESTSLQANRISKRIRQIGAAYSYTTVHFYSTMIQGQTFSSRCSELFRDAGTGGGGRRGSRPRFPLPEGARGAKVPVVI